jgi:hypothetical protein
VSVNVFCLHHASAEDAFTNLTELREHAAQHMAQHESLDYNRPGSPISLPLGMYRMFSCQPKRAHAYIQ